jgi:hypothetical protein
MATITIKYDSDPQKETSASPTAGMPDAPPTIAHMETASVPGIQVCEMGEAGPPMLADVETSSGPGGLEDLKDSGPPPLSQLETAGRADSLDDLRGAGPPPLADMATAGPSPGLGDEPGDSGPPSMAAAAEKSPKPRKKPAGGRK